MSFRLQELEVAALVGAENLLRIKFAIATLRHRRFERTGCGLPLRKFGLVVRKTGGEFRITGGKDFDRRGEVRAITRPKATMKPINPKTPSAPRSQTSGDDQPRRGAADSASVVAASVAGVCSSVLI